MEKERQKIALRIKTKKDELVKRLKSAKSQRRFDKVR